MLKEKEYRKLFGLIQEIRELSHRVDGVSDSVINNMAKVENLLNDMNEATQMSTSCEEESRDLSEKITEMQSLVYTEKN